MSSPENPPAFPVAEKVSYYDDDKGGWREKHLMTGGLTMRDYFAGQALAGILADATITTDEAPKRIAALAYRCADAMLTERSK